MRKNWTKKEDKILLDNPNMCISDIQQKFMPYRSKISISHRWSRIKSDNAKLRSRKYENWKSNEDKYILKNYLTTNIKVMSKYLNRSVKAINARWKRIKPTDCLNKNQWTKKEEQYLLDYYLNTPKDKLEKELGRKICAIEAKWSKIKPKNIKHKNRKTEQEIIGLINNICINGYYGKYISGYIINITNMRTDKCKFECPICHKIFLRSINSVQYNKAIFCRKCSKDIQRKKVCLSIEEVEQIIYEKGFKWIGGKYKSIESKLDLQCHCGKIFKSTIFTIKYSNTKTCGHCNDPKIGDIFGDLTVDQIFPSLGGGCSVICRCSCGGYTRKLKLNELLRKDGKAQKSCGNCKLRYNGIYTSKIALRLHKIIEQILDKKCEHNYYIKDIGCVDIVNIDLKIAIEYDGYYWHRKHRNWTQRDIIKSKNLIKNGWKFLNIKSSGIDIPTKEKLRKILLNDFQHGCKKKTITMKSWKDSEKKHKKDIDLSENGV